MKKLNIRINRNDLEVVVRRRMIECAGGKMKTQFSVKAKGFDPVIFKYNQNTEAQAIKLFKQQNK